MIRLKIKKMSTRKKRILPKFLWRTEVMSFICLSIFTCLPTTYSVYQFAILSIYLSVWQSASLSIYLLVCLFVSLSIYYFYLSLCFSVTLFVSLSALYLFIYTSICLSPQHFFSLLTHPSIVHMAVE